VEFKKSLDCKACTPELFGTNEVAIKIWRLTEGQFISCGMGIVGINHVAVWEAIDRYKVPDPIATFEKVLLLHRDITMVRINKEEQ